jgi:23S rRNA (cytidine1920-2'-O)/16S rRNA (cytidine1409-2'-O)-methyltransferase
MRLDLLLVEKNLAQSRSHAQELIAAGQVYLIEGNGRKQLTKASQNMIENAALQVEEGPANRYVSRGGLKLEGALAHVGLPVSGLQVLDVGVSTGGFSDCLLRQEADFVFGVDVGHGQLSPRLVGHPRFQLKEGVNARHLSSQAELQGRRFDLIVMDVSFISITLILPELVSLLKPGGFLLSLVKPQFEVGAEGLGKGGIVKDASLYSEVEEKVKAACESNSLGVKDYFSSSIEGKEGNREFFIYAQKPI